MSRLVPTLCLAAGVTIMTLPAMAGGAARYDGTWAVELVTESGPCDARYSTALAVEDGQVRPAAKTGAKAAASVTGRVAADGAVGLNVATSAASGSASGRLGAVGGAGTWTVSAFCSGRWTARRLRQQTAQAE